MKTRDNETLTDPVSEVRHYVANAHTLLIEEAGLDPETQFYPNRKHVRSACHYLWHSVLFSCMF